jgi:hypothetical protein
MLKLLDWGRDWPFNEVKANNGPVQELIKEFGVSHPSPNPMTESVIRF